MKQKWSRFTLRTNDGFLERVKHDCSHCSHGPVGRLIGYECSAAADRPQAGGYSIPAIALALTFIPTAGKPLFLAQGSHDIAPPVDYSLIPPWAVFVAAFVGLTLFGLIAWLFLRRRPAPKPPKLPRERALEALREMESEIERLTPYQFSIRVSDVLRRYVTEQFALPVTRQTSVEFLGALAKASPFSNDERSLLEDFLNRCDLIKFARYEASLVDSRLLLEEATRFVKGGQPVAAAFA